MDGSGYTKVLITAFTLALLLNGLNPWINPPGADAKESAAVSESNIDTRCSSALQDFNKNNGDAQNVKRLLEYIESSVNDIKMTVNGIDRKLDKLPSTHLSNNN